MIFDKLLLQAINMCYEEQLEVEEFSDEEKEAVEFSDALKKRMNRLFREKAGISNIPHPEVDNIYERVRSKIVRLLLVIMNHMKIKKQ